MVIETEVNLKQEVLRQLRQGQSHAIKGQVIAERLGFKNDRAVRLAIRELIASGVPIASSVKEPQGYYIAETHQEALEYMAGLRSRLIEDALRRRDFKLASYRHFEGAKQGKLL